MKILCFHNPDEENGYLSNWYLSEFNVSNITFSSMEQFMMYQKAMCFCDQTIAKKILTTHDVAQIKKFGRQVSNYNENRWNGIRQIVVYHKPAQCAGFSLSRNPVAHYAATGFLAYSQKKVWKIKRWCRSFHLHVASFFRFMAANLSFTQFVTCVRPLYCV